jgi:hypothetical protein
MEAYSTGIYQFWYLSKDMHSFLFHVEFEDGLSISVVKNRARCNKNSQLEIKKVSKNQAATPLFFHTPPFQKFVFRDDWSVFKRVKSK